MSKKIQNPACPSGRMGITNELLPVFCPTVFVPLALPKKLVKHRALVPEIRKI